ncbi:MAG: hypothetical protein CSB21_02435 [Deltaproteobacteria bacterium]|nr:MAG: hypothetical protein CSB21_02435 [Deltaproteobacteria bacterium]
MSDLSSSVENSRHLWSLLKKSEKRLDSYMSQVEELIADRKKNQSFVKKLKARIREDNLAAVDSLSFISSILIKKDGSYSSRVASLARSIGEELSFDKTKINNSDIIARLHLTGMLFKDYNPEEFLFFPEKAVFIVEKFSGLKNLASVFLELDECFDGSGPNSKKGSKVSGEIRIVRGAAFYYHLSHTGLSNRNIKIQLDRASGQSLDPNVVSALYKLLEKKDFFVDSGIKCVNIMNLKPEMKLESGIFSKKGAMLLPAGTLLDEAVIDKIKAYDKGESVIDSILVTS